MKTIPYFDIWMILCFGSFYCTVGKLENRSPLVLGLVSAGLWMISAYVLGFGILLCVLAQAGIFATLTIINMITRPAGKL